MLGHGDSWALCWFESQDLALGALQTLSLPQEMSSPTSGAPKLHTEVAQGTHRHGLDVEDEEVQSHGHDDGPQQPDVEPWGHPQQRLVLGDTAKARGQRRCKKPPGAHIAPLLALPGCSASRLAIIWIQTPSRMALLSQNKALGH